MSLSHTAKSLRTALGRWIRDRRSHAPAGCDAPATPQFSSRSLILRGWATGMDEVRIHVPGNDPVLAATGLPRPDHPGAGFLAALPVPVGPVRVRLDFRRAGRTVQRLQRTLERLPPAPVPPPPLLARPVRPATPSAAILISSGGNARVLHRNLTALAARTDYPDYTVTVIDNSRGAAIRELAARHRVQWFDWRRRPFSFAAMNNAAARAAAAELLVFLNDDVEAIRPDWLAALAGWAAEARCGAAGARLLYPNGLIQHAGIESTPQGMYRNAFRFADPLDADLARWLDQPRPAPAVTGACLAIRRALFLKMGGFDEERFAIAFNDVDLCLRLGERGLTNVYVPEAELYHFEALSKGAFDYHAHPREVAAFRDRWPAK